VDRGRNSIETLCLLLAYKIKFPDVIFMLRGNHECAYINRLSGFWDGCLKAWLESGAEQWRCFSAVFNWLPVAAIIEQKIFCVHGSLSQHIESLDSIRGLERGVEVPEEGLLCDLVWSDPDPKIDDWGDNERGTSVCFGRRQVDEFLGKFGFDLICRVHQAVMEGFEFPFHPNQSLITLFSAPNYCYEFENKVAILRVDERLFCSFTQLEPRKYAFDQWDADVEQRPGTPPRAATAPAPLAIDPAHTGTDRRRSDDSKSAEEDGEPGPVPKPVEEA
jgi:serine/threonine-protein phosphatase PP1 catalytic subunit